MPSTRGQTEVLVAIPCYNEAPFVGDIVERVAAYSSSVLVVDDGSTDDTGRIAKAAGAELFTHHSNQGYGAAIRSCFEFARDRDLDALVTFDGDGQHRPEDLPDVVAPILEGRADIVIGSRFLGKASNVPRYRKFGIDVITFLCNIGSMQKVSDAQSGFRAYGRRAYELLAPTDRGMGASVEILLKAGPLGLRVAEVPIHCVYHESGSSQHPVSHGVGVALKVIRYRVRSRLRS